MGGGPNHVLCLLPLPATGDTAQAIERLKKRFPDVKVTYQSVAFSRDFEKQALEIPKGLWKDVTVLVTLFTMPPSTSDAPHLELVQLYSAGSNQVANNPIYKETDIPIATASGVHGPQIAEWVIMTYLVHSHKFKQLYELQKERKWGDKRDESGINKVRDGVGLRLGILGYGSIGRQVARVCKAMGMDVIAYTATPKDTPEKKKDHGFIVPGTGDADGSIPSAWYSGLDKKSLHNFLSQDIDILLVSVPLTDETRHFLSTEEFSVLSQGGKKPAFVTNIARGPIIDQAALIKALKDDTLAGAALDVTDPEPLPEDNELWELPNVTVTPHVSGAGQSYTDRVFQILELQLDRKAKGEPLINVVNRKRGY
ncbi:hypothetical protein AAFC00_007278 [Neodothiora populina]|uniref:D-isomer specific 2-hydroxyacid dehydrogenase NAD-binding domain-containing protein n=1 Tax=Neodothiora populina TaxID=2781224 RepID=A0ABR3PHS9_9PEZI